MSYFDDMWQVGEEAAPVNGYTWSRLQDPIGWGETKEETKMRKEYEYQAVKRFHIKPGELVQYKPCATEFGKFSIWYYLENSGDMKTDEQIVAKLVEEKRFGWLDWLAEHTPFVTRTEKKPAYKFTPENLKLVFSPLGRASVHMKGTDGEWWFVFNFDAGKPAHRTPDCNNLPVRMDGDKIAVD